jgi:hypothetical protein
MTAACPDMALERIFPLLFLFLLDENAFKLYMPKGKG